MKKVFILIFLAIFSVSTAKAAPAELTISFNETFMDALLDGIFTNTPPPEFPLASITKPSDETLAFGPNFVEGLSVLDCRQSIRLQRETNGVRTAVRFRNGTILAPLAINGDYAPLFVGCLGFSGYAETRIDLRYDEASRKLMAYANVTNVNVNGTAGIGGSVVAKLVQSSIDSKINPIEIISLDKISFDVPIRNSAGLRMQARSIRYTLADGVLNVHIGYDFLKP
jgi:hypothetical protein